VGSFFLMPALGADESLAELGNCCELSFVGAALVELLFTPVGTAVDAEVVDVIGTALNLLVCRGRLGAGLLGAGLLRGTPVH
jgi:hypothetical protein